MLPCHWARSGTASSKKRKHKTKQRPGDISRTKIFGFQRQTYKKFGISFAYFDRTPDADESGLWVVSYYSRFFCLCKAINSSISAAAHSWASSEDNYCARVSAFCAALAKIVKYCFNCDTPLEFQEKDISLQWNRHGDFAEGLTTLLSQKLDSSPNQKSRPRRLFLWRERLSRTEMPDAPDFITGRIHDQEYFLRNKYNKNSSLLFIFAPDNIYSRPDLWKNSLLVPSSSSWDYSFLFVAQKAMMTPHYGIKWTAWMPDWKRLSKNAIEWTPTFFLSNPWLQPFKTGIL